MKISRGRYGHMMLETHNLFITFNHCFVNELTGQVELFKGQEYTGCIRQSGFDEFKAAMAQIETTTA